MIKKILFTLGLLSTINLTGCLPAVFVAGATAGGVLISDRRNMPTIIEDKKITCRSLLQLNSDPVLKQRSRIAVTTFNRVVLLTGEVSNLHLKATAYELVKDVPRIRRITNEITCAEPLTAAQQSADAWITTKVKTAMLAEKNLGSTQIKVATENKVVYLMGLVSHNQAELAIAVAREITGVKKVVTLFEYIS